MSTQNSTKTSIDIVQYQLFFRWRPVSNKTSSVSKAAYSFYFGSRKTWIVGIYYKSKFKNRSLTFRSRSHFIRPSTGVFLDDCQVEVMNCSYCVLLIFNCIISDENKEDDFRIKLLTGGMFLPIGFCAKFVWRVLLRKVVFLTSFWSILPFQ